MDFGEAIVVDRLASAETAPVYSDIHDGEIGVRVLHEDPNRGLNTIWFGTPAGWALACIGTVRPTRSSSSKDVSS